MKELKDLLAKLGIEMTDELQEKYDKLEKAEKDFVPRKRINDLNDELKNYQNQFKELEKKFVDVEPLQNQLKEFQAKVETMQKEKETILKKSNIKDIASKYKARDVEDLMKFIDDSKIKFENDSISGLEEQIDELVKSKSYLFETSEEPKLKVKGATPVKTDKSNTSPVYTKEMLQMMSAEDINKNWAEISKQLGNI